MNDIDIGYFKPRPQPVLDGELGLTSEDVARSIGISHRHLLQDLRGRRYVVFLRQAGFELAEVSANRKGPGRKGKFFVFNTEAAKAVVATSRTELGAGYLRYLIACEHAIEAGLPLLRAEIADLRAKLESLVKPKRLRGPGRRHRVVVGFRTVVGLFGSEKVPVYRDLALDEMTDDERRMFEAQHLSKISSGASKKAANLINGEVKPGLRSQKRQLSIASAPVKIEIKDNP